MSIPLCIIGRHIFRSGAKVRTEVSGPQYGLLLHQENTSGRHVSVQEILLSAADISWMVRKSQEVFAFLLETR